MKEEKPKILNLQYSSLLDSTVFKTVSRVTDQLRDLYYTDKVHLDGPQTIGDIIPTISKKEVIEFQSDVEYVINRINFDIFGSSLIQIPDPNNIYFIFIACHLDHTIQNNVEFG